MPRGSLLIVGTCSSAGPAALPALLGAGIDVAVTGCTASQFPQTSQVLSAYAHEGAAEDVAVGLVPATSESAFADSLLSAATQDFVSKAPRTAGWMEATLYHQGTSVAYQLASGTSLQDLMGSFSAGAFAPHLITGAA